MLEFQRSVRILEDSYDKYQNPTLIPVDKLFRLPAEEVVKQVSKAKEIITVCACGKRSVSAANLLSR
jgi:rhodanese-related sulfurtransferase